MLARNIYASIDKHSKIICFWVAILWAIDLIIVHHVGTTIKYFLPVAPRTCFIVDRLRRWDFWSDTEKFCKYWYGKNTNFIRYVSAMRPVRIVKWRLTSNFTRAANFSGRAHDKKSIQNKYEKISGQCKINARTVYMTNIDEQFAFLYSRL